MGARVRCHWRRRVDAGRTHLSVVCRHERETKFAGRVLFWHGSEGGHPGFCAGLLEMCVAALWGCWVSDWICKPRVRRSSNEQVEHAFLGQRETQRRPNDEHNLPFGVSPRGGSRVEGHLRRWGVRHGNRVGALLASVQGALSEMG